MKKKKSTRKKHTLTLRGGENKKVNSYRKTSKDNKTDALFDRETQEWINSSEDNPVSNGLSLKTNHQAQQMVGHKDIRSTQRYNKYRMSITDQKQILEKVL